MPPSPSHATARLPAVTARSKPAARDAVDPAAIYRAASTACNSGLVVQSMDGVILWTNAAYGRIMGYHPDELVGRNPLAFAIPPEDMPTPEEIAAFRHRPAAPGELIVEIHRSVRSNGELIWVEIQVSFDRLRDFGEVAILAVRDISDHIERQDQLEQTSADLRRLATTDSLTGLANRHQLMRRLEEALEQTKGTPQQVGLMHLDLDRFKAVNDTFGHSGGDAILRHVGRCLQSAVSASDLAARVGGDEFVLLCTDVLSESAFKLMGEALLTQIEKPVACDESAIAASVSIGAAIAPPHGVPPDLLLKRADFALYDAKERGRGQVAIYDGVMHDKKLEADLLAAEIKAAVKDDQLTFMFQPTLNLVNGHVGGFETLVRWHNPRLGPVPPDRFLPVARTLGLMAEVDIAAFKAALRLREVLDTAGFTDTLVGFNASEEFLALEGFIGMFFDHLTEKGIAPHRIAVEVLETVVFQNNPSENILARNVQSLSESGVMVLLDDFGTGHAGLTHLAKLAVRGVKIDRSLTENILTDRTSAKIIAMMHDLCSDLGLRVVTEGVETREQAIALHKLGGQVLQGYWLSKAMPADAVIDWLRNRPDTFAQITGSEIAAAAPSRYGDANDL